MLYPPITYPFTTFDIATDPATAIEPVNDGETITFQAGTFITPTVSPPRTILSDLSATGTPDATKFSWYAEFSIVYEPEDSDFSLN